MRLTLQLRMIGVVLLLAIFFTNTVNAKGDDFNSVVKMIEQFYGVKHQGIPFLAKAGMKAARTAARIKGGTAKQIAEAGSIKLAVFENQAFDGEFTKFRSTLNAALKETWMPLVQTLSATDEEQVYIFLRAEGASAKGVSAEGVSAKGVSAKGVSAEGVSAEGVSAKGVSAKGVSAEGVSAEARAEGAAEGSQGRVRSEAKHAAPGSPKNSSEPRRGDSNAAQKFTVLVVTIAKRDATVVQVTLSPKNLASLMKDPEGTGRAITEEATIIDQE